ICWSKDAAGRATYLKGEFLLASRRNLTGNRRQTMCAKRTQAVLVRIRVARYNVVQNNLTVVHSCEQKNIAVERARRWNMK
ncbi:MAG: hypothetical protein JSW47_02995, partial [Phycisphaerales bacterium]